MIGYLRVSTEMEGDLRLGIEAQRQTILESSAVVSHFETDVQSGKDVFRPGLQRALEECRAGRSDGIVVAKLDRLSRSVFDFATLLEVARKQHWNVRALDLQLDLGTPVGKLMANILMSIAQWEREMIGQRTREALAVKRAQGGRLGAEPRISSAVEREIRERLGRGVSRRKVCEWLNGTGVPTPNGGLVWRPSSFSRIRV